MSGGLAAFVFLGQIQAVLNFVPTRQIPKGSLNGIGLWMTVTLRDRNGAVPSDSRKRESIAATFGKVGQ